MPRFARRSAAPRIRKSNLIPSAVTTEKGMIASRNRANAKHSKIAVKVNHCRAKEATASPVSYIYSGSFSHSLDTFSRKLHSFFIIITRFRSTLSQKNLCALKNKSIRTTMDLKWIFCDIEELSYRRNYLAIVWSKDLTGEGSDRRRIR